MAKVLVLTSRWPWPPHSGDRVRVLEICRALSQRHELTLLSCTESEQIERDDEEEMFVAVHRVLVPRWRSLLNSLLALPTQKPLQLAYYYSSDYEVLCQQLIQKTDVVLAHLIRTAQYVPSDTRCGRLLEMTDAMSLSLERAASTRTRFGKLLQFVYRIELERVRRYEKTCLRAFDSTSVVSSVDRQYLAAASSSDASKLLVASLAVPQRDEILPNADAIEILFIGKVGTLPNLDACDYFISECLPRIKEKHPRVTFRIVGPVEPEIARRLGEGRNDVIVTGAVPDLRPYIAAAFCGVAPMRKGAGIQTKILDYMSYALPCVTTPVGYEGLQAKVGEEVLVAKDASEIAESVLRLLETPEFARSVGSRGREYLSRCHSRNVSLGPLIDAVDRLSSAGDVGAPL